MSEAMHRLAPHYLPGFITAPGETDVLVGSVVAWSGSLLKKPAMLCSSRMTLNASATTGSRSLPQTAGAPPAQRVRSSLVATAFLRTTVLKRRAGFSIRCQDA
ncbi:hypothetical protein SAMN05518861_12662 [Mesorhizobium sp. YR577]|nr:hypothetical protein SAMN05518861_12662 [Mesorhizobium sp. YR577]